MLLIETTFYFSEVESFLVITNRNRPKNAKATIRMDVMFESYKFITLENWAERIKELGGLYEN